MRRTVTPWCVRVSNYYFLIVSGKSVGKRKIRGLLFLRAVGEILIFTIYHFTMYTTAFAVIFYSMGVRYPSRKFRTRQNF